MVDIKCLAFGFQNPHRDSRVCQMPFIEMENAIFTN
jgi:hypothetical protein